MSGVALGWDYLVAQARSRGYHEDAQEDFSDAVPPEYLPAPANSNHETAAPSAKRIPYSLLGEQGAQPEPYDFIEGVFCDGQCSVIYGDTNTGKTFAAMDAALHVARGKSWLGREVDGGPVIYIAGEGGGGIWRRIKAHLQHHGITDPSTIPFALINDAIDFRDKRPIEALIETARELRERFGMRVRWIIVDTLSRALAGGNENAPDDMGALVRGADRVRSATGAHLTFIHHTGKDENKGARGHSLLKAAVDTELEVKRQEGSKGVVCVNITKQRDLEIGPGFAFQLLTVDLGTNRRGKPITSCVVEPAALKPVLTEAENEAVQILQTLLFESEAPHVDLAAWREAIMGADDLLTGQTGDSRKKQWQRLRDSLKKKGIVEVSGNSVWAKHG